MAHENLPPKSPLNFLSPPPPYLGFPKNEKFVLSLNQPKGGLIHFRKKKKKKTFSIFTDSPFAVHISL